MPLHLAWEKFSAVKIDYYPHEPELHTVTNDHRAIIQLAMRRVIAAGYRRIGFVMPSWWDHFADLAWSAGFLAEQQVLAPEEKIPIFHFSDAPPNGMAGAEGREMVAPRKEFGEWLRKCRPEVLISKEQFVQPRLAELGLTVPRGYRVRRDLPQSRWTDRRSPAQLRTGRGAGGGNPRRSAPALFLRRALISHHHLGGKHLVRRRIPAVPQYSPSAATADKSCRNLTSLDCSLHQQSNADVADPGRRGNVANNDIAVNVIFPRTGFRRSPRRSGGQWLDAALVALRYVRWLSPLGWSLRYRQGAHPAAVSVRLFNSICGAKGAKCVRLFRAGISAMLQRWTNDL